MKKYWTKIAIALGPTIMIASVAWEYARTNKDYNFLIEPWALNGSDMIHGQVIGVTALLLLVGGMLTAWEASLKQTVSAATAVYFVVAATGFTWYYADNTVTTSLTTVSNVMLSTIIAASLALSLRSLLGQSVGLFKRALPLFGVFWVIFVAIFGLTIVGLDVTVQTWVMVLLLSLVFAGMSISIKPMNMAANRMLILASVAGWGVVVFSAGAIRETLIRVQMTTEQPNGVIGVSAQYKDTQTALGWWLAGLGVTVLFVGAVGLWAKRRDIVAAIARARKQREAAEKSAREIEEAAEQYALEQRTR